MPARSQPQRDTRTRVATKIATAIAFAALLTIPHESSWSDDTFLFRVQAGKPYVNIVFDTSSSMNVSAELGGSMVPANGDSPLSTFYQAKSAVYEVFNRAFQQNGDFIHYGLVTYNQDGLRVRGKHWLYSWSPGTTQIVLGNQGIAWPAADESGNGEVFTFGANLPVDASPDPTILPMFDDPAFGTVLGSCQQPVNFSANRAAVNRFPKLHPLDNEVPFDGFVDDMAPTKMWLEEDGIRYEVVIEKHSESGNFTLGLPAILVNFSVREYEPGDFNCTAGKVLETKTPLRFDFVRPFLMHDLLGADNASDLTGEDLIGNAGTRAPERQAGIYHYQDYTARAVCGDNRHPLTGRGGEMNYDGSVLPPGGNPAEFPNVDPFQVANPALGELELNLKQTTALDPDLTPEGRVLDVGDMIPYHWERTHREEFFSRLAPNWTPGKSLADLDFGIASYFRDVPNDKGFIELIDPTRKPLTAFGDSPVAESLVDWRCFFLGSDNPGGKCANNIQPFGRGYDWLAPQYDLEWGCRRPFLIVIGDGENNCIGEDPSAGTANLRRNRVQAWVINFGGPDSPKLRSLATNTGGEYIPVATRDELLTVLEKILGEIVEQTRAFASAVVPTVQAEEADKVFVSSFKPLNQASVWPGDLRAFLKPVPLDGSGRPDTSTTCASDPDSDPASECFLWNTGDEMLDQVQPINTQFGLMGNQRRVYYSQLATSGNWPSARRYAAPTAKSGNSTAERYDLWRGLGLIGPHVADGSLDEDTEAQHEAAANEVLLNMVALKTDDNNTEDDLADDRDYILGDIFHSDPLIVGTPTNSKFFALNLEDDGTACEDGNPSYRCFFRKHEKRRKVVMFGSNDGQIHGVDAGIFRTAGPYADEFDRGTGKELFAFMPRHVMPTVRGLYGEGYYRDWTVDGSLNGLDVFIDPLRDSEMFPDADEREWRTVVVGGLRRGGSTFHALDVTQPDAYNSQGEPQVVDQYVPSCADGGGSCGPNKYPSQLWEFSDSYMPSNPLREIPFDLDQDGIEDMVASWSTPNLGLIKVCTDAGNCDPQDPEADIEDRYVAIVGGGLDKTNSTGNFLYMIDIETGQSIYKRELLDNDGVSSGGAAAAEPAAVDTDGDGYLDRIYMATLKGYVYRVELRGPNGEVPLIADSFDWIPGGPGIHIPVAVQRIVANEYRPHIIFKAQPDATTPGPSSRAIYFRPSVIFSAALGQHVLAIGTGDRENLWSSDNSRGEFYVFKDDIPATDHITFYTEANLEPIDSESDADLEQNLLTAPGFETKGWHMTLREGERMITSPFAVSGVIVFTVFDPDVAVDLRELTCSRTGRSRVFGVTATNGNGLLYSEGSRTRWVDIADFVTEPYIEQSQTKNPDGGGTTPTADDLTADHITIMDELKKLFPSNCRFANYRLDIKTLSSDTGVHLIAPIPICIIEKSWKEF